MVHGIEQDRLLQEDSVNETGSLKRSKWGLRHQNAKVFEMSLPGLSRRVSVCFVMAIVFIDLIKKLVAAANRCLFSHCL